MLFASAFICTYYYFMLKQAGLLLFQRYSYKLQLLNFAVFFYLDNLELRIFTQLA